MKQLYDENGYKERKNTYRRIADRYWWDDIYEDVRRFVDFCDIY